MKDKSNYCTEHKRADVLNVTHIRQSVTGFVVRKKIINWRSIEIALNITTKLIFINEIIFSNVKYIINIPILIIAQRYATQSCLFIILQVHCTCFGYQPHPSSGVHKTVNTASGTGHIFFVQLPSCTSCRNRAVSDPRPRPADQRDRLSMIIGVEIVRPDPGGRAILGMGPTARLLRIADSNPTGGVGVCRLWMLCVVK